MVLEGLRVVVTGGRGALGSVVAERLAAGGARVAVLERRAPPPESAAPLPAGLERIAPADLVDEASVRDAIGRAAVRFGGLDTLVNVAGGFVWESFEQGSIATWERMQALNLRTTLLASWATLPYLLTSGQAAPGRAAIVNVAAAAGLKAGAGMGAYAAAKSGVMRLTEAMADEFKARGLRVNAVLPGVIDTAANRAEMPEADFTRWVRPHEVAEVVAFLASPAASGLTGALLPVTGRV